jgi:hypothetical protein
MGCREDGREGGAQRPFLRYKKPKKRVSAAHGRVAQPKHTSYIYCKHGIFANMSLFPPYLYRIEPN